MDGQKKGPKTNERTEKRTNEQTEFHQFRKEPSYDGQTVFELESGNENVDKQPDGQMDGQKKGPTTNKRTEKRTNEQTEFHQFRKEPSYDGDLYPCEV